MHATPAKLGRTKISLDPSFSSWMKRFSGSILVSGGVKGGNFFPGGFSVLGFSRDFFEGLVLAGDLLVLFINAMPHDALTHRLSGDACPLQVSCRNERGYPRSFPVEDLYRAQSTTLYWVMKGRPCDAGKRLRRAR